MYAPVMVTVRDLRQGGIVDKNKTGIWRLVSKIKHLIHDLVVFCHCRKGDPKRTKGVTLHPARSTLTVSREEVVSNRMLVA